MGYTWCQFDAYVRLARRRAAQARLDRMVDTNLAVNGGKGAGELLAALAKTAQEA